LNQGQEKKEKCDKKKKDVSYVAKGVWHCRGGSGCLVVIERGEQGASNGVKMVVIGGVLTELWWFK
jgi:hypothetical protein